MTVPELAPGTQAFYARKLYALLREAHSVPAESATILEAIPELGNAASWWETHQRQVQDIGSASDRVSLHEGNLPDDVEARHPISGQSQILPGASATPLDEQLQAICNARAALQSDDPAETFKRLFFWCWRFYPQLRDASALLHPAHRILPDCPIHSYNSTVSALTGAMFPPEWENGEAQKPYLLLFTFSPVQEFIKASRKFADFWSGSYMLHYLSARLCWQIAQAYGPDAVITPSLWSQEIIDALLANSYPAFADELRKQSANPTDKFNDFSSRSLSTAGFPNTITALVPGKKNAIALGKQLQEALKEIWCDIAKQVRTHIKTQVIERLSNGGFDEIWEKCKALFPEAEQPVYEKELRQLAQHGCWEWNKLWAAQIENTWQPYFVAVPLGHPEESPICMDTDREEWIKQQNAIAQPPIPIPTDAELNTYEQLNVGTWWGSLQARLGQSMQAIKNTRRWQIPTAPGERSSLSGQFSALHPRLHYEGQFKQGRGMPAGSIRLFWQLISLTYPGLFDGSERLNALELTKRMAWRYGGVAKSLGILIQEDDDYEKLIRFPNMSSLAAAHFASRHPEVVKSYWKTLRKAIQNSKALNAEHHEKFCSVTHRAFQIKKADDALSQVTQGNHDYNGVMFSSKWLVEDMNLKGNAGNIDSKSREIQELRSLVAEAHKSTNFGDSSPADWWVLLLADGDSMGQYVSGRKLKSYDSYVVEDLVDSSGIDDKSWSNFLATPKRMGPATHVGLNRALLDFSNRLVPHLTEHRYCGRVIYSGGDDVLVALPLADLPGYMRSLRAAWCGDKDLEEEFDCNDDSGYWKPHHPVPDNLPDRPLFTMGAGATMSMGIVVAHKSVPLPTVLENLWDAEKEKAKKLIGGNLSSLNGTIPAKDGLCFKVIYGSGNTSEALMKGHLLDPWWEIVEHHKANFDLSPVLNRLAEELPKHAAVTEHHQMCCQAAKAILLRREDRQIEAAEGAILSWISQWEAWAWAAQQTALTRRDALGRPEKAIGTTLDDLAALLRFTAFWVSRRRQELNWTGSLDQPEPVKTEEAEPCLN